MSSRRAEIRAALLTALQAINGTGDFETAPAEIIGFARIPPRVFPSVQVADDDETRELHGYQRSIGHLAFRVYAWSGRVDSSGKIEQIDKLVADIERAIGSDPTLGLPAYGVQAQITDISVARGLEGEAMALAVVTIETEYRLARGEP